MLALRVLNFSRGQLAAAVGVDKSLVSRWASGQVVPTDYNLARISEALAKVRPGFNMTLWERPRAEFDAFFGAVSSEARTASTVELSETAPSQPPSRPRLDMLRRAPPPRTAVATICLAIAAACVLLWFVSGISKSTHAPLAAAVREPTEGSIAVLPFANTSGDPKQLYFAEGLSDELIGLLARNSALRVAARTSSYSFEGKNEDVRAIAEKLNVRAVLEGSVRTDNGRVRIEASLINAKDGYEVWSQSYDRSLSDILLVQSDIAHSIVFALVPKLLNRKSALPRARAVDPAAYRLYLEGLVDMNQRRDDAEGAALPLLRKAVQLAPDFADAQAALAYDLNLVARSANQPRLTPERDAALAKALALDPTNPLALCLSIALALDARQWDKAIDTALILKRSNVHNVDALRGLSDVYDEFGLSALQLEAWQEAVRLDPLSLNARMNLADMYFRLSRKREAIESVRESLKLGPGNPHATSDLCNMLASTGQVAAAKAVRESMTLSGASRNDLNDCQFLMARATGDSATQQRICNDLLAQHPQNGSSELDLGFCFGMAGESDRALDWFERASEKGQDIFTLPFQNFLPSTFFQMPRWVALTKTPSYQLWSKAQARAAREFGGS